jgi:cytochrome oxidase Cu insertion factor (SCO1/SenC/PrrC family)
MYTKRQMAVLYVAATFSVAFAGAATWLELQPAKKPLERYRQLPEFALTNQDGDRVTLDDFKGKVWLADFVYTTCPGPCPIISAHMARLERTLPEEARMVSFSTDPDHDNPTVLKAYARRFGATDRWTFLTGPKDEVYDLIRNGFMLPIDAPPGAQVIHSTRIMLVDKTGAVRGFYDGTTSEPDGQIAADVRKLIEE